MGKPMSLNLDALCVRLSDRNGVITPRKSIMIFTVLLWESLHNTLFLWERAIYVSY